MCICIKIDVVVHLQYELLLRLAALIIIKHTSTSPSHDCNATSPHHHQAHKYFSISRLQSCHALPDLHEFWAKDILPHVVFRHVAIICHAFLVLLAFAM